MCHNRQFRNTSGMSALETILASSGPGSRRVHCLRCPVLSGFVRKFQVFRPLRYAAPPQPVARSQQMEMACICQESMLSAVTPPQCPRRRPGTVFPRRRSAAALSACARGGYGRRPAARPPAVNTPAARTPRSSLAAAYLQPVVFHDHPELAAHDHRHPEIGEKAECQSLLVAHSSVHYAGAEAAGQSPIEWRPNMPERA